MRASYITTDPQAASHSIEKHSKRRRSLSPWWFCLQSFFSWYFLLSNCALPSVHLPGSMAGFKQVGCQKHLPCGSNLCQLRRCPQSEENVLHWFKDVLSATILAEGEQEEGRSFGKLLKLACGIVQRSPPCLFRCSSRIQSSPCRNATSCRIMMLFYSLHPLQRTNI